MSASILTSLDFLKEGQEWPPPGQMPRLKKYQHNKKLFNKKNVLDPGAYRKVAQVMAQHYRVVPYGLHLNFFRKISYKTADLLFIEQPSYIGTDLNNAKDPEANKPKQAQVDEIASLSKLNSIGHQGAIDTSRFGDAVFLVKKKEEKGIISISQPSYWYPVATPDDLKEIQYHVLAWKVKSGQKEANGDDIYNLDIRIYSKTELETRTATLKDGKIESVSVKDEAKDTGLDDFAVLPVHSVVTSDTIFGDDDYTDTEDIITEIETRLQQTMKVLDKHAEPSMSGPASALLFDEETGSWTVKGGSFYGRNTKDDPEVKYITWDGQLEASFQEIDLLMRMLGIISEMGAAIFDTDIKNVANLSGRALRMLYINALNKVARTRNAFDEAFKNGIRLASQIGYDTPLEPGEVSIKWRDGLPDDPFEKAQIGALRLANGPSDSVQSQIMAQDGVDMPAAEEKYQVMLTEDKAQAPEIVGSGLGIGDIDDED